MTLKVDFTTSVVKMALESKNVARESFKTCLNRFRDLDL